MFDFQKIADGLYGLYKGGERVTPLPLTREELDQAILDLPLTDAEIAMIDAFYEDAV